MAVNFKSGLFGLPPAYQTPGIGDGLPNAQPQPDPGLGFPSAAPAQQKPSFFGQGGVGRGIAGALGDALMQMGGLRPSFGPLMQQRQAMAYQEKMRQQNRADDWQDFQRQKMFEYTHKPANPGSEPDIVQLQRIVDDPTQPESVRKAARDRVTAMNDPIVNVSLGGRDFAGPRSLFLGGNGATPNPSAPPPTGTAGPGVPHLTVDQMGAIGGHFGAWQQRERVPVLVTSAAEMARVPKGTMVISPDGRTGVKQ